MSVQVSHLKSGKGSSPAIKRSGCQGPSGCRAQSYRSPYDAAVMTTMTVAMTVTMMMALIVIRADCPARRVIAVHA